MNYTVNVDVKALKDLVKAIDKYINDIDEAYKKLNTSIKSVNDEWVDHDYYSLKATVDSIYFTLNENKLRLKEIKCLLENRIDLLTILNNKQLEK